VPEDAVAPRGQRILVVDDEPHIRRILVTILEREGFHIIEATDGSEGLAALEEQSFDFAILDFMMPGATGIEILEHIRASERHADLPVIILTAKGQDTDREAAMKAGADDFLTKPFSPMKLLARIHRILEARG
jgi:DNA-binding response OmpR family regulator